MSAEQQIHSQENPKAVIYCRVSSRSQEAEGHGLESQETRCRQHAAAKGYDVAAVFPDTITGGGDFMQRPGMVALLSFLDAQPDERFVVIFDDLKRFARDTRFHLDLREAFRLRGAKIECLNFKFDETPEGEFIETIMAAQGALERKQNGRQVSQKMRARMENGYWIHYPPIGYRFETIKGRGKMLVPHQPYADMVRDAFEGYASGRFQTQAEIRRYFESLPDFPRNKAGVITQQRVTDMLTHPIYTGYICSEHYGIVWLKGQHEALISLKTFEKAKERRAGAATAPYGKSDPEDFALRGMVVCACCDVPLRSSWSRGRSKRYPYYLCQTKGCDNYGKSIARDKVEADVGELVKTLQPTKGLITLATKMFRDVWNMQKDQAAEIVASAKLKLGEIEKQTATLLERIMETSNPAVLETYEAKIGQLNKEKALLTENIENQVVPAGSFAEKLEPALMFLSNPWKIWESGSVAARKLVLKLAFTDRIRYCRNEGARTAELAFPFKALSGFTDQRVCYGADEMHRTYVSFSIKIYANITIKQKVFPKYYHSVL